MEYCQICKFWLPEPKELERLSLTEVEFRRAYPSYLTSPEPLIYGRVKRVILALIQWVIQFGIKLVLKPRHEDAGVLDIEEVNDVYTREAATYDGKHHITTNGRDTDWRRKAGYSVSLFARQCGNDDGIRILDLCTGTGLTALEIGRVLEGAGIQVPVEVTGLDYNEAMLAVARRRSGWHSRMTVRFVRGDAMNLHDSRGISRDGLVRFSEGTFDVVSQVFGIGGINEPVKVFVGVLKVLRSDGLFYLTDMHQPIATQPGEWSLGMKWLRMPLLERVTYQETTVPLALQRLWGWRDPTLDFYQAPLITYEDASRKFWGFDIQYFDIESQRWWGKLPVMPVASLLLRKVEITEEEAQKREALLKLSF